GNYRSRERWAWSNRGVWFCRGVAGRFVGVLGICCANGDGVCERCFCVGGGFAACERSPFGVVSFSLEILFLNEGGIVMYPIKPSKKGSPPSLWIRGKPWDEVLRIPGVRSTSPLGVHLTEGEPSFLVISQKY